MTHFPSSRRALLPLLLAIAVPALAAHVGCGQARDGDSPRAAAIEVTDDDGRTLRLDTPASRVVSLIPARTDILLALSAADRLVARTQFDADPRLASLPAIDEALTPSLEWLIGLRPDLVIAWPDQQNRTVVTRLVEIGIPVYASRVETLGELRESVREIGRLVGRAAAADSLNAELDSAIAQVSAAVRSRPPRSVLYLIGLDPPMAAGPGTFVDEMIQIAGGRNVMHDAPAGWPAVSVEEIVDRQPDLVLLAVSDTSDTRRRREFEESAGFRQLRAVAQGRVMLLDANLFNRPGPALAEALRGLVSRIHPELLN